MNCKHLFFFRNLSPVIPRWYPGKWVWFKRHVLLQIIVPSDFSWLTQDTNVCLQSWTRYATPECRNSSQLSGTKFCFQTWLFIYHLSSGGDSSVKDLFLSLPLATYHLRKKIYTLFCFFLKLYCNLLYLCICKISEILKPVNVGTMLQKKTNQLLHLISWTNQMEWNLFFGSQ